MLSKKSTVGIISNVYPMDVNLAVDKKFLQQIHDAHALYMLKNDENIKLSASEYQFTDLQQKEYEKYAVKCSYTEPNDNPNGTTDDDRVVCRCINTSCRKFKECRALEPFSYYELVTRFGFKHDRSLINVELFERYYNTFSDDDLLILAKQVGLKLVPGFVSIDKAIKASPLLVKNLIKRELKKQNISRYVTIEEYINLKKKDQHTYKSILLIDLFNDYNTDFIQELLKQEGVLLVGHDDVNCDKLNESHEEVDKLKKEKEDLEKNNKKLVRLNRNMEEGLRKRLKEEYDNKLKTKLDELKAEQKVQTDNLNNTINEIENRYNALSKEYQDMKEKLKYIKNLLSSRDEYYKRIIGDRTILLLMLRPRDSFEFPCNYFAMSFRDIQVGNFPDEKFDEVWLEADKLDAIKLSALKNKLNKCFSRYLFREINSDDIKYMKLEVLE